MVIVDWLYRRPFRRVPCTGRAGKSLVKRLLRGPWLWIVVAVVGVLVALQYLTPNNGADEIPTSQMEQYITSGQVKEITFVDGDQLIKATLDKGVERDGGSEVHSHYLLGQQEGILDEVR